LRLFIDKYIKNTLIYACRPNTLNILIVLANSFNFCWRYGRQKIRNSFVLLYRGTQSILFFSTSSSWSQLSSHWHQRQWRH